MFEEVKNASSKKRFEKVIIGIVLLVIAGGLFVFVFNTGTEAGEGMMMEEIVHYIPEDNRVFEYTHFLQDLDYLTYVLVNNFDLFDLVYRVRGTDINAELADIREAVLSNPGLDVDGFFTLLARRFNEYTMGGRFSFFCPAGYFAFRDDPVRLEMPGRFRGMIVAENVLAHYLPRRPVSHEGENEADRVIREFADWYAINPPGQVQRFIELVRLYGEYELADELEHAVARGDMSNAALLRNRAYEIIASTPIVQMEIIEENRVAYLSINSFQTMDWHDHILSFYDYIADFDHLIIDLRRNNTGSVFSFIHSVMSPNITRDRSAAYRVFFKPGSYNELFTDRSRRDWMALNPAHFFYSHAQQGGQPRDFEPLTRIFTDAVQSDFDRMEYGFSIRSVNIYAASTGPSFGGKIWMLTGPHMEAASELAARMSKNTNFATLVGERTGGHYGGPPVAVALPNTGILFRMNLFYVTDERGRALEEGTLPHHFNRAGYDALATALQLIAEGSY